MIRDELKNLEGDNDLEEAEKLIEDEMKDAEES
jgi:hypothetical protein